jgi:CRP/FNR family transcriptional regulator, cyclic AMP receptor protein
MQATPATPNAAPVAAPATTPGTTNAAPAATPVATATPTSYASLASFELAGDGEFFAEKVKSVVVHNALFDDFTLEELKLAGPYMRVYRAPAGATLIHEGAKEDVLLFIIEGMVDVVKTDHHGHEQRIGVVLPGQAIGEMSMVDNEARYATCRAIEPALFSAINRSALQDLLHAHPLLGAKILLRLVFTLTQRLRQTSAKLVGLLEERDLLKAQGTSS